MQALYANAGMQPRLRCRLAHQVWLVRRAVLYQRTGAESVHEPKILSVTAMVTLGARIVADEMEGRMSKVDELGARRMTLEEGRKIHEDWLAYIERGASVDTESLGDANWHRSAIKDYDAWIAKRKSLIKRVEELEAENERLRELAGKAFGISELPPNQRRARAEEIDIMARKILEEAK